MKVANDSIPVLIHAHEQLAQRGRPRRLPLGRPAVSRRGLYGVPHITVKPLYHWRVRAPRMRRT